MSSDASRIILRSQDEGYYLMKDTDSLWSTNPVTITPPSMVAMNVESFETALAMSADGMKVVALGDVDPWLSTDGGVTWAKVESLTSKTIEPKSVSMSPDGSKILICGKSSGSFLAVSHDGGSTWTELPSLGTYFYPLDCSMSADGQTIAAIANGHEVMVSTDGGSTFSASTSGSRNDNIWQKVLVSKDGSKILVSNTPRIRETISSTHTAETAGYISFDSGATWTRPTGLSPWIDMAMSDDGNTIYVLADMECSGGGYQCDLPSTIIWSSLDGGSTWQKESVFQGDRGMWSDIEVTPDGSIVVAIEMGTLIGTWGDITVFHKGWPTSTSTSSTAALRVWAVCRVFEDGGALLSQQMESPHDPF